MSRKRRPKRKLDIQMRRKLVGLFGLVVLALVVLGFRITYINAKSGAKYSKQVLTQSQQQYTSRVLPYKRGDIYDVNGTLLATSSKVYNVVLDCKSVNSDEDYVEPTIKALSDVLGIDAEEVRSVLTAEETASSQYQILKKEISIDDKQSFEDYIDTSEEKELTDAERKEKQNVKGVWFEETYVRSYPLDNLACDVIGFTYSNDNSADYGLEGYYANTLNGVDGRQYGYFTDDSSVEQSIIEPTNGESIVTTIDVGAQQIVEKYVQGFMDSMGAQNVGVIVERPSTGEIIAMATDDSYDLNDPRDLTSKYSAEAIAAMNDEQSVEAMQEMWSNYCVTDAYEPGSVIKPIVMASALECGAIQEDTTFVCDGGQDFGGTYIKCTGSHGSEALMDVIANSCNDGMMQVGAAMGAEKFIESQTLFNFGSRTGIDLPGEGSGVLHTMDSMGETELACSAFGQGFTCTMIQEINAMASVINGGNYYQPHIVSKVLDSNGGTVKTIEPTINKQTISTSISADIRSYMEASVQYGTSKHSKVEGYSSGGKTGTAEKLPRGNKKYLVSFIGFAPVSNPEVLVYVVIDEPKAEEQANSAYPQYIAQGILSELLPYLNVQPDESDDGTVPYTELWEGFSGHLKDVNSTSESDTTDESTDEEGTDKNTSDSASKTSDDTETSEDAVSNPNAPSPLEDTTENDNTNKEESDGITNEDAGYE